jgi:hypothetical protein
MPFGQFLEIESNTKNPQQYADQLGLEWSQRITFNYLDLFFMLKKHFNLPFNDITFENFKDLPIGADAMRSFFQRTACKNQ